MKKSKDTKQYNQAETILNKAAEMLAENEGRKWEHRIQVKAKMPKGGDVDVGDEVVLVHVEQTEGNPVDLIHNIFHLISEKERYRIESRNAAIGESVETITANFELVAKLSPKRAWTLLDDLEELIGE